MITVLGCGSMGRVCAHFLCDLGHKVQVFDIQPSSSMNLREGIAFHTGSLSGFLSNMGKVACVLSCLPYHQNVDVAKFCIDNSIPYCDLGGDPPVEDEIKSLAQNAKAPVFLSLGLAPGLVNIFAHRLARSYPRVPETVNMYVGGLPQHTYGGEYKRTWSSDGLYNEYKKDCEILERGKIVTVKGLSGYEELDNGYEAFYTSGGISHSLDIFHKMGVKNASYRTMRYKGHRDRIQSLVDLLDQGDCISIFNKIFPTTKEDKVKMKIEVFFWDNGTVKLEYNHSWYSTPEYTAMQRATCSPTAAIVSMVANRFFPIGLLSYEDLVDEEIYETFETGLYRLGFLPKDKN